jgi:hypothetical protein
LADLHLQGHGLRFALCGNVIRHDQHPDFQGFHPNDCHLAMNHSVIHAQ